jgi:RNA polymerase sigma-70 factor (ECF subfamily)
MGTVSDEKLAERYLEGDEESLRLLIGRYLKPVYNFVYRYAGNSAGAEDVTQEVFINMWKHLKRFDRDKKFKTWLFAIAKNASLKWLRKKRPALFSDFENEYGTGNIIESIADSNPTPEEVFSGKHAAEKISTALNNLNPADRAVLASHYGGELSFREISESSNQPVHTVKSRHRRALAKMRKMLS